MVALTHIYHYSNVVWDIVLPNVDNKIASLEKRSIKSSIITS